MKEKRLPTTPDELVGALEAAALEKNWDQVNGLVPLAAEMNGDRLVTVLHGSTWDLDNDIRDAAMTAWSFIEPEAEEKRTVHLETALRVMERDSYECSAIWAAVTVSRYVDDENLGKKARGGLSEFKRRITLMDRIEGGTDWQETRDFVVGKNKERLSQLANFI